ncbi:MAG: tRNA threonylcarbamoyladenosine dehydratase [Sphaerochaetaceae bacterium]|nr:tRNA threonylcarbamoyladenosine dehydratase [Sphaerochaetaceae bacterium]
MNLQKLQRITALVGKDKVLSLENKFVVLVGVGAVGSFCLEALSRSGIGKFRLVDFDTVEISNINRQLVALDSTLGEKKVEVAKERVKDIESSIEVETLDVFLDQSNIDTILGPDSKGKKPDLIIDAIDSLSSKILLLQTAYEKGLPIVSSMGAALRTNPALVTTADIMKTYGCPLAKHVRYGLRKNGVGKGIMCVFSSEEVNFNYDNNKGKKVLGSLPTLTGIFGLNLAHLALKELGLFKDQ